MVKIWINLKKAVNNSITIKFFPGAIAIAFVIGLRMTGWLQVLEWIAFDSLLRLRPTESIDERILIVGINEDDIRKTGYPVPDRGIAALLNKIKTYQPAVIGLDIVRDLPQEPGHEELVKTFKSTKNLIGIEKILPDTSGGVFNPPPDLPSSQIGFADSILDKDGKQRRSLLAASDTKDIWKFSFPLKLAEIYLQTKNISLGNVENDEYGMRFGSTILPRFHANSGSYIKADANGSQILINFRNRRQPFQVVSLTEILKDKVNPDLIRNKIILIGMTSPSAKDYVNSSAIDSENPALIYGVEIQAHIVSQLVSAVLDKRPMINVLADEWEYLWIFSWGFFGITVGGILISPWKILIYITIGYIFFIGVCYGLLILGWWVPFVPAFLTLGFNYSAVLIAFYKYTGELRSRIQERQLVIDQTFDAIHSYPLQTLNMLLREVQDEEEISPENFVSKLQQLNQELRSVYDLVKREVVSESNDFHLRAEETIDIQQPLHKILHEVYDSVVTRNEDYFDKVKFKVLDFKSMDERKLTTAQKQSICRFLEEALRNVEKYAVGTTRIEVTCSQEDSKNVVRVVDNGLKIQKMNDLSTHSGFGTKQAKNLAKQLGGEFKRYPRSPKGMVCQLTWCTRKRWFWKK